MKKLLYSFIIVCSAHFLKAQAGFTNPAFACANASILLSGSSGTLSNPNFTWSSIPSGGVSFSSPNNSLSAVAFNNSGNYTISLNVNSGNTSSSFQNTITIGALPIVTITASSFTACISSNFPLAGKPFTLTASGATSYTWNLVPTNSTNASQTLQINSTTCFSVSGEDANGCSATSIACVTVIPRFSITVTPSNTYVCYSNVGGSDIYVELTANKPTAPAFGSPSSHSYAWSGMGLVTSGFQSTVKAFPMSTTTFTAQIKDSLGCISLPAIATVSAFICMGIESTNNNQVLITVFPNPARELLTIQLPTTPAIPIKLYVQNLLGQYVKETTLESSQLNLDLSSLPKGAYILKSDGKYGIRPTRFIKD